MPSRDEGLHAKYRIERVDDPSGRHADCDLFVLDVTHDSLARAALATYAAQAREKGYIALADDLDALLTAAGKGESGVIPRPDSPGPHARPTTTQEERDRIHAREYPEGLSEAVDTGVSAVWAEFHGDSWRNASAREVVGVVVKGTANHFGAWQAAAKYVAEQADNFRREGWKAAVERLTAAVGRSPYDETDPWTWKPMCGDMTTHGGHRYAGAWCTGLCDCSPARPPHAPGDH